MEESSEEEVGVEVREEMMVPIVGDGNPTMRVAHFLKPCIKSIDGQVFELPTNCLSSVPVTFETKKWPLKLRFHGWKLPQKDWKKWVEKMAPLHEFTWKEVGIHEAILNSMYEIRRNYDLVLGLAEKWCSQTKSFIFSWGEATITLEDMVISGYSVLGSPVFRRLETDEMEEVEDKLNQARMELKAEPSSKPYHSLWLKKFLDSGSEIEHEAFLSLWLSRFVFPFSDSVVCKSVLPIAVHLARGTRLALAPAILASIYRDLSLLKEKIVAFTELVSCEDEGIEFASVIRSPFQLVQIWAWERFVELKPMPKPIKNGEPRFARWHKTTTGVENVRTALDSAKDGFLWRPYVRTVNNWNLPKFYVDNEMWLSSSDADLTEEFLSFARCLRVSKLVGLDCIEQYLPHRVAMQFGLDQDLPACVGCVNESRFIAWKYYSKPIRNANLYISSRFFEADVTTRYLEWWKQSKARLQGASVGSLSCKRSLTGCDIIQNSSIDSRKRSFTGKESSCNRQTCKESSVETSKMKRRDANASDVRLTMNSEEMPKKVAKEEKEVSDTSTFAELPSEKLPLNLISMNEADKSPTPPGFPPKCNLVQARDSFAKENLAVTDSLRSGEKGNNFQHIKVWDGENSPFVSLTFPSNADNEAPKISEPAEEVIMRNEPVNGGSESAMDHVTRREGICLGHDMALNKGSNEDHEKYDSVVEDELEDWVSRLEKIVAELKHSRSGTNKMAI